ncbi:hypothetical protein [Gracilibacillus alcaliphilus]|uniref:hypothetical protein n=1 Tax=Gracilibacillus alcaliphilus TaxID=1401441 RepID=UPI00195E9CF6|nr:hypothetical protein [Gracilibacillus alcaliphilus]MBM7676710.1 putative neutral ceramidase superfamily lipid hydrolase [Gracilibacillus alcaliphilus]
MKKNNFIFFISFLFSIALFISMIQYGQNGKVYFAMLSGIGLLLFVAFLIGYQQERKQVIILGMACYGLHIVYSIFTLIWFGIHGELDLFTILSSIVYIVIGSVVLFLFKKGL